MSVNYAGSIDWDLGEQRHIKAVVKPKCGAEIEFEIEDARYELVYAGNVVDSGECLVDAHEIDAYICPESRGNYELRLIYKIADETWVDVVKIKVG